MGHGPLSLSVSLTDTLTLPLKGKSPDDQGLMISGQKKKKELRGYFAWLTFLRSVP